MTRSDKEYEKNYYLRPDVKARHKVQATNYSKARAPSGFRNGVIAHFKHYYGLTPEEYMDIAWQQDFRCAICGVHEADLKDGLHVDHSHVPPYHVRGLLCRGCNLGLGWYERFNSGDMLPKIMEYLR